MHQLKAEGLESHIIARRLGLDPTTVRRYADAASPDDLLGPSSTGRRGLFDPYKPYLQARIDQGIIAINVSLQEIRGRGYRGGERSLRRWLVQTPQPCAAATAPPPIPSSRTITGWIRRPADKLSEDDTAALKDACTRCPDLAVITELAPGFTDLVRHRHGAPLHDWITQASSRACSSWPHAWLGRRPLTRCRYPSHKQFRNRPEQTSTLGAPEVHYG